MEIRNMGGLHDDLFSNKEILDFFEPIFRSDISAVEQYHYEPMIEPFKIPIHLAAGVQEDDVALESWQRETKFPIKKKLFSGNHFFIFENANKLVQMIVEAHCQNPLKF